MSWIKRHNAEIFRKKVRDELSRRLSDRNYSCSVESEQIGSWYGREMYRLNIHFGYLNTTLTIRLGSCPEYWDYEDETVSSACDKIIDRLRTHCWKFSPERSVYDRSHFAVDFLMSHIIMTLGGNDES